MLVGSEAGESKDTARDIFDWPSDDGGLRYETMTCGSCNPIEKTGLEPFSLSDTNIGDKLRLGCPWVLIEQSILPNYVSERTRHSANTQGVFIREYS